MNHAWKNEERIVAKMFGTRRRLMKGTDEKEDIGYDLFPYSVDVKLWKVWSVLKWFKELAMFASERGKPAILTVRQPGKKLRLAIVCTAFLEALLWKHNHAWRDGKLYSVAKYEADKWRVDYWFRELEGCKESRGKIPILYLRTKDPVEVGLSAIKLDNLISIMKGAGYLVSESDRKAVFTREEIELLKKRIVEEDI